MKTAEEILFTYLGKGLLNVRSVYYQCTIEAMEAYHAQFSKEVTDEEIEKSAKEFQNDTSTSFNQGMYSGYIFGMQACRKLMRDGLIKGEENKFA